MSPARSPAGATRGLLMAIGGAEDKKGDRRILRRFVDEAGGPESRVVVFPTASELRDTGETYARLFDALEVDETFVVDLPDRQAALEREVELLEVLEQATGIFFAGGNQLRLTTVLGGTRILQALRRRNAEGVIVAGTSAGAALLSEHMIAFGESGMTPGHAKVTLVPGMGLTNKVIVDQHFRQRDRLGRLVSALSYNPFPVGLGVDEDTAALIDAEDHLHVIGRRSVVVLDACRSPYTNADRVVGSTPIALFGVTLHVLTEGCTFDLGTRTPQAPSPDQVLAGTLTAADEA
jgi:cyanophycinase